jgi:hypothetical protein
MKLWQVLLVGLVFGLLMLGAIAWVVLTLFQPRM